jgi:hypothetical protein
VSVLSEFEPCKICQKYAYELEAIVSPNGFNDIETEKLQIKGDDGCVGNVKFDTADFRIHTRTTMLLIMDLM